MARDFRTILTGIVAILDADASLRSVVGTRICQGWPSKDAKFPMLVLWPESSDAAARVDQGSTSVQAFVMAIEAASYNPNQLRQIEGYLFDLLDGKSVTVSGWRNVTMFVEGGSGREDRDMTPTLYRRVWTLTVVAQPN